MSSILSPKVVFVGCMNRQAIVYLLAIFILLFGITGLSSCESQTTTPFPPPQGFSSWDEYYQDYQKQISQPTTSKPIIIQPTPSTTMLTVTKTTTLTTTQPTTTTVRTSTTTSTSPSTSQVITITYESSLASEIGSSFEAAPSKIYLILDMTITNQGYSSFSVGQSYFEVIVNGIQYSDEWAYGLENRLESVQILSSGTIRGKVAFEVPQIVSTSGFSVDYDGWETYNIQWEKL